MRHTGKKEENILKAFKGETPAKWIYHAFAEVAEKERNDGMAKLFRAASAADDVHAHALTRALKEMSTATNDLWLAGECTTRK
jgi:rubrerythrin